MRLWKIVRNTTCHCVILLTVNCSLPSWIVAADTTNTFKSRLDSDVIRFMTSTNNYKESETAMKCEFDSKCIEA